MFLTYLAVLDALHSAHGGKSTDERAAILLQIVGLHLSSVQHNTVNALQKAFISIKPPLNAQYTDIYVAIFKVATIDRIYY